MKAMAVLLACLLMACSTEHQVDVTPNTDLQQLNQLISLEETPLEGQWSVIESGEENDLGPNDWALVAVLTFTPETINQLIQDENIIQGQSTLPAINWYPESFIRNLEKTSDDHYTTTSPQYSAEIFFASPLLNGYIIPIKGTSDIFVYLHTT